jgi:hypothetical protein
MTFTRGASLQSPPPSSDGQLSALVCDLAWPRCFADQSSLPARRRQARTLVSDGPVHFAHRPASIGQEAARPFARLRRWNGESNQRASTAILSIHLWAVFSNIQLACWRRAAELQVLD